LAEEKNMLRCLELAQSGRSLVAPNPMVGAVIVHKGQIIGEGFHRQYGGAHAEVNAIQSVRDETLLRDSTLYVNLEPCAHQGKTPPCTGLIIRKQIPRVVVGCVDPSPEVSGKGIKLLRDAGIDVVTDVLKDQAVFLNRYFITAHTKLRPYIILKWAQSSDGYIDRIREDSTEKPVQFSIPASNRYVHRLRSEVAAIMVGTNTAWLDNPSLTVRHWVGQSPVRIVLDRTLRIPQSYHLLDGTAPTIVFTEQETGNGGNGGNGGSRGNRRNRGSGDNFQFSIFNSQFLTYFQLDFENPVIPQLLNALYARKIYSLLVEGGACLHRSFLDSGLWDELQIETSPLQLGFGVESAMSNPSEVADFHTNIHFPSEAFNQGNQSVVSIYLNKHKV
jgi:diaminohydroxyphosphoribosylaminopyrimidine deaminase/5-amino-6-(5-phosphoribosylamino)uracil reductase